MNLPDRIRRSHLTALFGVLLATTATLAQEKPQPQTIVDLKPLGAAADLFTDQSDSKHQQRGVLNLFWVSNDRIAAAFSTTHRWSESEKPSPLNVRLLIFDPAGKQLNQREWNISAEGPAGDTTLEFAPGPDNSILAVHESNSTGKIPDGDFIQVLNADISLRQNFYVPATSAWVPGVVSESSLVLQTFYADKHASLAWWSGHPLKSGSKLDISRGTEQVLAGPGVAARAICETNTSCSGILIFRVGANPWLYSAPSVDITPVPRVFLSPTALLVELRNTDEKQSELIVAHADGPHSPLPVIPKSLQTLAITSIANNGQRFALDSIGEGGLCGALDFWCKQRGQAMVIDIPANKIIFQQEISPNGGVSALSPDGKHVAIFDRNKLSVYALQ